MNEVDGVVERVKTHHAEHGAEQLGEVRGCAGANAPLYAGSEEVRVVVVRARLDQPFLAGLELFNPRF